MADGYWMYQRQQVAATPTAAPLKRPRSEYGGAPAPEMLGYYPREEDRTANGIIRDTAPINSSYDHYLQNGMPSYGAVEPVRPIGVSGRPVDDPRALGFPANDSRSIGYGGGRVEPSLPPDASNTLFVEGLPTDCSRREVAHIFRPFLGYQEVRLVNKEHPGGDTFVLCFVDFATPGHAAVALDALQGYAFDEYDRESPRMRLQYARFPGRRSFAGPRGGRR